MQQKGLLVLIILSCATGTIDGHHSRNIEALYVYLQFRQRVDNATAGYCLGLKFFFTSSLMVER